MVSVGLQSARRAFQNPLVQKVIIAIVVAIIIYIAYRKIFGQDFSAKKLPTGGSELPSSWVANKVYVKYADNLWAALDGISNYQRTNDVCVEILNLTDDQIVTIANYYNTAYGKNDKTTLTSKLQDEWLKSPDTIKFIAKLRVLGLN